MNSAVIFITNKKEEELARASLFNEAVINYTIAEIRRLDVDTIYLVGDICFNIENVIKRDSINEIIDEVKNSEGKCLLVSPLFPLIDKEEYKKLLDYNDNAVLVDDNDEIVPIFMIHNNLLGSFEKISYKGIKVSGEKALRFTSLKDIHKFQDIIKEKINNKWLNKGVIITDPKNTIIGVNVAIDKNTTIYPNVTIEGKTLIGKNNVITSGTSLYNVVLGNDNYISDSKIYNSIIHNNVKLGPNCHIDDGSELFDAVEIGSFVKLSNTKVGKDSKINHLCYFSDTQIGDDVKIGAHSITVNDDGRSKHQTIIKDHGVIGSGVTMIAPITIGEYGVVADGSTVDEDVKDGDLAIARLYQQNKKGYGYKYKED